MAAYRTLDDADISGKRVLVRADLNVPVRDGRVTDATRLERIRPTIDDIVGGGGRVILISHFDRPKGKRVPELSLAPIARALGDLLGRSVAFSDDCVGQPAADAVAALADGDILVLENTRFHAGEEANDREFAAGLAALGDLYVNDAFSAAHRAHASTEGLAHFLPAFAGRAMQAELDALDAALGSAARPLLAIVGGAKVSTKLDLLENLIGKVDTLVIGGAMANTVLLAHGKSIGRSLAEPDLVETVHRIEARTPRADIVPIHDVVTAAALAPGQTASTVTVDAIPDDEMVLDFGPESIAEIKRWIDRAATIVWNGPLGAFETQPFDAATIEIARHVASRTAEGGVTSVAGGGDTVAALNAAGVVGDFTYVSTAGGAFLEWLEGKQLPGVAALSMGR